MGARAVSTPLLLLVGSACASVPAAPSAPSRAPVVEPLARAEPSPDELQARRQAQRRRAQTERIRQADRLSRRGEHAAAVEILQAVVEQAPSRTDALLRLGNARLYLDDIQGAIVSFETAYHLGADSQKLPRSIAELWLRQGDLDAGLVWLERARERHEDDGELRLRIAQVLLLADRTDEARDLADKLLIHDDQEVVQGAHVLLGYVAMSMGDEERAVTHWEAAAERELARRDILSFLGEKHYREQRFVEAARYYTACLELGDDEQVHRRLVRALMEAGRPREARAELLVYLEKYPDSNHRRELASAAVAR